MPKRTIDPKAIHNSVSRHRELLNKGKLIEFEENAEKVRKEMEKLEARQPTAPGPTIRKQKPAPEELVRPKNVYLEFVDDSGSESDEADEQEFEPAEYEQEEIKKPPKQKQQTKPTKQKSEDTVPDERTIKMAMMIAKQMSKKSEDTDSDQTDITEIETDDTDQTEDSDETDDTDQTDETEDSEAKPKRGGKKVNKNVKKVNKNVKKVNKKVKQLKKEVSSLKKRAESKLTKPEEKKAPSVPISTIKPSTLGAVTMLANLTTKRNEPPRRFISY